MLLYKKPHNLENMRDGVEVQDCDHQKCCYIFPGIVLDGIIAQYLADSSSKCQFVSTILMRFSKLTIVFSIKLFTFNSI